MSAEGIKGREWEVLEHFIVNESRNLEYVLRKFNKITPENVIHFSSYPGKIESESGINRVTVGDTCRKFLKMEIFKIAETKHTGKKGGKTNFYSLRSDLSTIRKLVRLILEIKSYSEAKHLLDNYYFTCNLNEALVREVLSEKNVQINRLFYPLDWKITDASRIVANLEKNEIYPDKPEPREDLSIKYQEIITSYENEDKKIEKKYVDKLKYFCESFSQNLNDPPVDEIDYYFKDYDLYNISRSKYQEWLGRKSDYLHNCNFVALEGLSLILPTFKDNTNEEDKLKTIMELNLQTFYDSYYGYRYVNFKSFPSYFVAKINSIIREIESLQAKVLEI
ncbi:hypothetical protein [Methanococcoides sp.]|jgi:hypothetical protein|uniref:hypothetical protein n=1 Tax=Methanococcoides sp. TaxID=1966350 RepID=UPI00272E8CE3|nr:hypothetical protein [Methanococcoides sp.]